MENNKETKQEEIKQEVKESQIQEAPFKERKRIWPFILRYSLTILGGLGLFFLTLYVRDVFKGGLPKVDFYRYMADAFTIPGITLIFIALLFVVAAKGAFLGLGYALRHVGRMLFPFFIKKDITYAEYLEDHEARKNGDIVLTFIIVGALFMIGAIVFIALFYSVYEAPTY